MDGWTRGQFKDGECTSIIPLERIRCGDRRGLICVIEGTMEERSEISETSSIWLGSTAATKLETVSHRALAFGLVVGLLAQQDSDRCHTGSVNCGASSLNEGSGRTSSRATSWVNSPGLICPRGISLVWI